MRIGQGGKTMASRLIRLLMAVVLAVTAFAVTAFAADADYPHKKGDVIVYFKNKGTTTLQASSFAQQYGMSFKRALRTPGIFLITIPGAQDFTDEEERVRVQAKLDAIRQNSLVKYACLNHKMDLHQVPNDPMFGNTSTTQWNLYQIGLPGGGGAWAFSKGNSGVLVAVLDDGFNSLHPDLKDAFSQPRLTAPYDAADGMEDADVNLPTGSMSHGLMTSGVIAAGTDNGIGIAGVTWEGVQVKPVKIADDAGAIWFELVFDAYQHILDYNNNPLNTRKVAVQSMSYGSTGGPNPIEDELLQMLADQGVILCASAGNNRPFIPAGYPASLPQVISVAATVDEATAGFKGIVTSYSSFGLPDRTRKVDLAAPSSDVSAGFFPARTLLYSTSGSGSYGLLGNFPLPDGGTSYACPTVAGAIALMLSFGFPSDQVLDALKTTGVPAPGDPKPNVDTGWGEIDTAAAMALVVPGVIAVAPVANTKFQYQTVKFHFRTYFMASIDSVEIELTGGSGPIVVPGANYTVTPDGDNPAITHVEGVVRLLDPINGTDGTWTISCNGTGLDFNSYTDSVQVTAQQRVLLAGTSMFSVPFRLASGDFPAGRLPEELFAPGFEQYRWIPDIDGMGNPTGSYASYTSGSGNTDLAGFTPSDADIIRRTQIGEAPIDTQMTGPFGVGLWVITGSDTVFDFEEGPEEGVKYYQIRLKRGWNQVGNPYEFFVDWNSCSILQLPSRRLLDMATAVNERIIRPQIFRYEILLDGSKGYTWESIPRGHLRPIDSHWIYAIEECYLQVPPLKGSETPGSRDSRIRGEGWLIQLSAKTEGAVDTSNFFGATKNFNERFDRVFDPPASPNGVRLWFETQHGRLAQDLRELGNTRETFVVKVMPSKPNARVTLNWNDIVSPQRRMRTVIKDEATGKTIVMRQTGAYEFTSDDAMTPRTFTIASAPEIGGRLAIGGVRVAGSGRGNGSFSIEYSLTADANVSVRVLSQSGRPIADLAAGSRSAGPSAVTWSGRDSRGKSVAPGVYIVQITAESASGERVRRSTPITVTR